MAHRNLKKIQSQLSAPSLLGKVAERNIPPTFNDVWSSQCC
jgi:hypothetical protein